MTSSPSPLLEDSKFLVGIIKALQKVVKEGKDNLMKIEKDLAKKEQENLNLKTQVSSLTKEIFVSILKTLWF